MSAACLWEGLELNAGARATLICAYAFAVIAQPARAQAMDGVARLVEVAVAQSEGGTVVVIDDKSAFGQGLADAAIKLVRRAGREVSQVSLDPKGTDQSNAMAEIVKSAARVVVMPGGNEVLAAQLAAGLAPRRVKVVVPSTNCTVAFEKMTKGKAGETLFCIDLPSK